MTAYPRLFSPIRIGNITLKNRIAVAPMGSEPNTSGFLSEQNLAAYELRAQGGAAVVTRGETLIGHPTASAHGNLCNLGDERFMPSHLQLTDVIHQHNALASIEILHCGARAHPKYTDGVIWGPSSDMGVYGVPVLAMDEDMMEEIADSFAQGAFVAKFAGFDLVMIHGGHGWLLSQFLSPLYNRRRDRFGGSLENRARFPLLVIDRIRARVGPDFPIEYRMSGDEFFPGGYGLEEAIEFARIIDGKVDLIHVSAATFRDVNSGCRMFPSAFLPHGVNTYLAAAIKKAVKTPVATVGALSDPAQMEAILAEGQADIVVMGRQILADPDFPVKVRAGGIDRVRPCLRCNHCLSLDYVPYVSICSGISQCAVNPVIGRELRESRHRPKPPSQRVVIAGGGPGGMQAAISAAAAGHSVVLCEQRAFLGGPLLPHTENVPFKADLRRFLHYLIRTLKGQPSIEVCLTTKVSPELVEELAPDLLICAIGSKPVMPPLPGIGLAHVTPAAAIGKSGPGPGAKTIIIGGGLTGCELGLILAQAGKDVTLIEQKPAVASDAPILHRKALLLELAKLPDKLMVLTECCCTKISAAGVFYRDSKGCERFLPADSVVVAAGQAPPQAEVDGLRRAGAGEFIAIGDCVKPGRILAAVHGGYFAGRSFLRCPGNH